MEFTIGRENLLEALKRVNVIINAKEALTILTCFLFKADGQGLEIVGNNGEMGFMEIMSAEISQEGSIALPARKILDIVQEIGKGQNIKFQAKGTKISIKAGKSSFSVSGFPSADYPAMPSEEEGNRCTLKPGALMQLFDSTYYAMAPQEEKRTMNGLSLTLEQGGLRATALDGYRLATGNIRFEHDLTGKYIIPRKAIGEMSKLLDQHKGEVVLNLRNNLVMLHGVNQIFYSRLLEGEFPDTSGVLNLAHDKQLTIDRDLLLHALRRVSVMSDKDVHLVEMELGADTVHLSSQDDVGEAEETVPGEYHGEPLRLGLNSKYLIEALSNIGEKAVILDLSTAERAVMIRGEGQDDFRHIVMPTRL